MPTLTLEKFPLADEVDTGDLACRAVFDAAGWTDVLTAQEVGWGCVRPYRFRFFHLGCGKTSSVRWADMALHIARYPLLATLWSIHHKGIFCQACRQLASVGESGSAVWLDVFGRWLGKVGT